ncbi:MAG: heavy metal sensor histidine kinase [Hydrogenophaga sp.]|jgi:two-component system, OmpR family, heavy metal sensor histidine kinase CusS|uniref:heavy metal sensor histidine kinase n=1 Tax=Hydrogenophaga sp. TaxID=1904254 RepID=UPI00260776CA|nr:heavy metal sensor histidine kinase [Hydrogenophaga sp.]MCV0438872.1 heavy metal sensor histidine kinase [Hydrogenophaga sp.]
MIRQLTLTTRLSVLYTLVSASVLLGLGLLVAWSTHLHFVDLDRHYLQDKVHLIQKIVDVTPDTAELTAKLDEMLDSHHGLFIAITRGDEHLFGPGSISFPPELAARSTTGQPMDWADGARQLRGISTELSAAQMSDGGAGSVRSMRLTLALDTQHHTHFMQMLRQQLAIYVVVATLLSGMLGWWAARSGLAPLRTMKERALKVTAHKLDQRMPIDAVPVEMADLANSLNTMLERLELDFAKLMDFSSDIAHELRTPLSNLLTETQVSLSQRRDPDTYRDILASNAEELQRLARMVSDMLFLAKTDHGIQLPNREHVVLEDEVGSLLDFYDAVAEDKEVRLRVVGEGSVVGDRLMIRRAISNLLSNALRHSHPRTDVEVEISSVGDDTTLCVSNTGDQIDASDLPRLFDRFYRADKARAHSSSDGAGLGLAITKAIMVAHGGSVSATPAAGTTRFCLQFPGHQGG